MPFEVGQNVSIGLGWTDGYASSPHVSEVSIVRHGRVPGAEITHRTQMPAPAPARASVPTATKRPEPAPAPPAQPRKPQPQPVTILHRNVDTPRDPDLVELDRRMDWHEARYGRQADPEQFIKSMRRELDGCPTLDELTRDRRVA